MNYRHIYHAGNFADVVKHLTIIAVIKQYLKKDKPFAILDSFAGIGLYDLKNEYSLKTAESEYGVKLLKDKENLPPLLEEYYKLIKSFNKGSEINFYPGSPAIAAKLIRLSDRVLACELHPEDAKILRKNFRKNPQVMVHELDAYQSLKALLPFQEKRGIVFLDPPFEKKQEFKMLLSGIELIYTRFAAACTVIWYPVKEVSNVKEFYKSLQQNLNQEKLLIEFGGNSIPYNLKKMGMIIINPPFIKEELQKNLSFLARELFPGEVNYKCMIL